MRRRLTRREKNKRNKQIIMVSSICLLVVMVSGYAAFQTNLSITAKGNIKCSGTVAKELLLKNVVETGDGLYKDIYEEGKYTYKGANPNNYITFNNELWRIISIEEDGTIKIMRNGSIGSQPWDSSNSNNWTRPATLNTYLNGKYYDGIDSSIKNYIVSHSWGIGAVTYYNNDLAYQISDENGTIWIGNVGLITVSEYLRANTNIEQCGTLSLNNDNYNTCKTTNWMHNFLSTYDDHMWTISPSANYPYFMFSVYLSGIVNDYSVNANGNYDVVPVLHLISDIALCGSGTEQDSFQIMN